MKSFFNYAKNRILYNIFRFLFFLIIALILLSSKVNALEVDFSNLEVQGYNNNGSSLTSPNIFNCSEGSCGMEITTNANSYGGAFVIQSPIPIINNHNYSFSIRIRSSNYDVTTSSKPYIALGNSIANAKLNYEVSNYHTELLAGHYAGNSTLQYVFKANATATHFTIPFTTSVTTTASFMIDNITIEDLGATSLSQTDITNIMNSQTSIIQDSLSSTEENINNNFNNTMNSIFGGCESSNIFDKNNYNIINGYIDENTLIWHSNPNGKFVTIPIKPNTIYTILRSSLTAVQFGSGSGPSIPSNNSKVSQYIDGTGKLQISITTKSNDNYLFIYVFWDGVTEGNLQQILNDLIVVEGSPDTCKNKIDVTNDKLEEANQTSKGIWDTLKNLPKTIIDGFLDLLISVFVPEESFFENWFLQVKLMFEEQLGFLATPFTIIIEFIQRFTELSSSSDIIIDIPDIKVPNFENATLIKATTFNWSSLLNSKDSLKNLWTLYLDFIDVFLILNFIGLCSSIYARIFGGDTSNYEYYTVEDTYTVNDSTGEVTNHRLNQRTTKRKKVN